MISWKTRAALHFALYCVDMSIAIAGMAYGFGIQVQNWWALVGLMLVSRFVFNTANNAMMFAAAEKRASQGERGE
jgi:hypothetical protein